MSRRGAIHRYFLIVEKIRRVGCPSFLEIPRYLKDQGFEINPRTLQRDISDLRDEFDIEIKYDRQRTGYFIEDSAHEGELHQSDISKPQWKQISFCPHSRTFGPCENSSHSVIRVLCAESASFSHSFLR